MHSGCISLRLEFQPWVPGCSSCPCSIFYSWAANLSAMTMVLWIVFLITQLWFWLDTGQAWILTRLKSCGEKNTAWSCNLTYCNAFVWGAVLKGGGWCGCRRIFKSEVLQRLQGVCKVTSFVLVSSGYSYWVWCAVGFVCCCLITELN